MKITTTILATMMVLVSTSSATPVESLSDEGQLASHVRRKTQTFVEVPNLRDEDVTLVHVGPSKPLPQDDLSLSMLTLPMSLTTNLEPQTVTHSKSRKSRGSSKSGKTPVILSHQAIPGV